MFDIKDEEVAEEPVILMSNVDKEELKEALATPDAQYQGLNLRSIKQNEKKRRERYAKMG